MESVTRRLISSGIARSPLRRPASTCATGRCAFFATLALAGLFVGLASLEIVHRVLRRHVQEKVAWGLLALISALSGYAIYLGRFLRWNSWDLFTRPLGVLGSVVSDVSHARPWGVSAVFGAIIFASYVAYWGRAHAVPQGPEACAAS